MASPPFINTISETLGGPVSTENKVLETGAAFIQDFSPIKQICAHLNAFHAYADDPSRYVEANHYCSHLTEEVRQCIIYDGPGPKARLIGIEYMITPSLYAGLDHEERKLWHSHVFEVKSGMLIMPGPTSNLPIGQKAAWEAAETQEMKHVVTLYGKVYHLWQTDRGDKLPLGKPKLMTSFAEEGKWQEAPRSAEAINQRDERFGTDWKRKKELREGITEPMIHEDADQAWKVAREKGKDS